MTTFADALAYHKRAAELRCTGAHSYAVETALLKELDEAIELLKHVYNIQGWDREIQLVEFLERHQGAPYATD